jgi:hypothetical protein
MKKSYLQSKELLKDENFWKNLNECYNQGNYAPIQKFLNMIIIGREVSIEDIEQDPQLYLIEVGEYREAFREMYEHAKKADELITKREANVRNTSMNAISVKRTYDSLSQNLNGTYECLKKQIDGEEKMQSLIKKVQENVATFVKASEMMNSAQIQINQSIQKICSGSSKLELTLSRFKLH